MANEDLKALLILHEIDCYPVDELTPFVLNLDPGAVWDWIRRVVAPFEKLKTSSIISLYDLHQELVELKLISSSMSRK